ncbi:MAG: hypothetical protein J0I65_06740 [Variovorax sp.]|nr:hypothetical protein [Variovorax sp.]
MTDIVDMNPPAFIPARMTPTPRQSRSLVDVWLEVGTLPAPRTARDICHALMAKGSPHPLRTVYRSLDKLASLGLVSRFKRVGTQPSDRDEWQVAAAYASKVDVDVLRVRLSAPH